MKKKDQFNLLLIESQEKVDKINKAFYGRFNFPWPPISFQYFSDQHFGVNMLNQDTGNWKNDRIPGNPKIWVAGCGTNQAIYTALTFPNAEILGTDISTQSLETCKNSANQVGIKNLELEEKSINNVTYREKFDYIICTGVIHHNANPIVPLKRLATALKPNGILELMVYNYYHRLLTTAYQKAIRTLCGDGSSMNLDLELSITEKLIKKFPMQNLMSNFLSNYKNSHKAELADALLQPVEHSNTIKSLEEMITNCNLEFLLHCINKYDKDANRLTWNMKFNDAELDNYYESLTDSHRWQISNLLMFNDSPLLWFYLQRKDSFYKRKTEKQTCEDFLDTKFEKYTTTVKNYVRDNDGKYRLNPTPVSFPSPSMPPDDLSRRIFNFIDKNLSMRDIFRKLKLETSFHKVNYVRINLTTKAFPYIKAVT
jgi:SAM-dependent methyltransferase